jgi:hypothetical protein
MKEVKRIDEYRNADGFIEIVEITFADNTIVRYSVLDENGKSVIIRKGNL